MQKRKKLNDAPAVVGTGEQNVIAPANVGYGVVMGVVHRLSGDALHEMKQIHVIVTGTDQRGISIGEQLQTR